jgi:hypothetical protein
MSHKIGLPEFTDKIFKLSNHKAKKVSKLQRKDIRS